MDFLDRNNEVRGATRALEHALKSRKDLEMHTRHRLSQLISRAKKVNARTSESIVQDLTREVSELDSLFTATDSALRPRDSRDGTIGGMTLDRGGTPSNERDANLARDFERIQVNSRRINNALATAPPSDRPVLVQQLRQLLDEQDRLVESRHPISRGALVEHPAFAQAVREGYQRMNANGQLQFSPSSAQAAIDAARRGIEQAGSPGSNPYGRLNPLNSNREQYQTLLNQNVVRDAYNAARRALLDERASALRARYASAPRTESPAAADSPTSPATETTRPTGNPGALDANPSAEPASAAASPNVMQPVSNPTPGPSSDQLHPQIAQLAEEISKRGGNVNLNIIGDVGSKNTIGGYPGNLAQAPAGASGHGHSEAAPGHAVRGGHEATPQETRAMVDRYNATKGQEDAALEACERNGTKENWDKFKAIRRQQRALADQIFAHVGGVDGAIKQGLHNAPGEAERGQNAATATEARNAMGSIRARTKDEAARMVAEKTGGDQNKIRRWFSALVRWPAAVVSGMATGAVGYAFASQFGTGLGTFAASLGVPASWLGAGALGSIPATIGGVAVPFIGGLALPAIPVVAAALAGVAVWQLGPRKWLGFKKLDDAMDKGWQAKKLYKKMRAGDSAAVIDAKFAKISSRPTWRRMQTIPRIFGTLLGGMAWHDLATLSKGGSAEDLVLRKKGIEAYELGKRVGGSIWERFMGLWNNASWPEWCRAGEPISRGANPADFRNAAEELNDAQAGNRYSRIITDGLERDMRNELRRERLHMGVMNNQIDQLLEINKQRATEIARLRAEAVPPGALESAEARIRAKDLALSEYQRQLAASRAEVERLLSERSAPRVAPRSTPGVSQYIPPASQTWGLEAWPGGPSLRVSDLSFVIDESTDIKSIPQGLRQIFDSIKFEGKTAEWLIDTIDKMTYNGTAMRGGREVMQLLTGERLTPGKIPDETTVNLVKLFTNNSVTNALESSVANSNALTTAEQAKVRRVLDFLERVARTAR